MLLNLKQNISQSLLMAKKDTYMYQWAAVWRSSPRGVQGHSHTENVFQKSTQNYAFYSYFKSILIILWVNKTIYQYILKVGHWQLAFKLSFSEMLLENSIIILSLHTELHEFILTASYITKYPLHDITSCRNKTRQSCETHRTSGLHQPE